MILAFLIFLVLMGFVVDTMQTSSRTPQFLVRLLLIVATGVLLVYHVFLR